MIVYKPSTNDLTHTRMGLAGSYSCIRVPLLYEQDFYVEEKLNKAYRKAVIIASYEMGLEESAFPATCPYSFEQAMDEGFFPD